MTDNMGDVVATGLFVNVLYDFLKASICINGQELIDRFSKHDTVIHINEQHAEQIIEAINSKNLKSEAEKTNREAFNEKFLNDNQLNQIVDNINQTYIANQTNIETQNNFNGNSRQINIEDGKYVERDSYEIHHHYSKEQTPKK